MKMSPTCNVSGKAWPLSLATLALAALAALPGCAAPGMAPASAARPASVPIAAAAPAGSVSDFSAALRCMDNLLLDHGARDLSVIVEDLVDPTQRFSAGTKDMLVNAVSDMTQRSRAIRLVASGKDWGHTQSVMTQALKREPLAVPPQYALRGSISLQPAAAANPGVSVLGLNLTLLTTHDMSVVPGTASRNSVAVFEPGSGRDGQAELHKFGARFALPGGSSDGQSRALRGLVEVASIELIGRLARVPYWSCLGANAADEAVASELQDWYDVMAARPAEIIGYFQRQLRTRRLYDGPIDGVAHPALKDAVARYRAALGLSREPKLTLDFFKAYLGADHAAVEARLAPAVAAAAPPTPAVATPLALRIAAANDAKRFARGEAVQLTIRPSRDAHVYCFLQDEHRKVTRFFPNRFVRDSRVQPGEGLRLPGAMRFEILMNPRGVPETVACFATERDVLAQLPAGLNAGDFDPLPVASLDQVRSAFAKVADGALAHESFEIRAK
jgi:uncharacterized protein DUF4384